MEAQTSNLHWDLRPRILFVDDEPWVLEGLRRALHDVSSHWDMTFLSDPQEAVTHFAAHPAHVVISDFKMPGLNGIEMILVMRKLAQGSTYILLTGFADLPTALDAINRAGIFRFFTKPCPADQLAEAILAALAHGQGAITPLSYGQAALNTVSQAVMVLDQDGRVLFRNQRCDAVRISGACFTLGAICRTVRRDETSELHRLIRLAMQDGGSRTMRLTREDGSALVAAVTPLEDENPRLVSLILGDPDDHPIPSVQQVETLLDLTASEARLAHALAQGQTVDEAANGLGITTGTARTYLKQIFVKTGKSRQADLVRLILSMPVTGSA